MDADLQKRLERIFGEAHHLSQNPHNLYALDYLRRHIVEAEEVLQEHDERLRLRPNTGGYV